MADCLNSRKCSGTKLRSWFWWILVEFVISFPCVFSMCLGVNISVAVYPQNYMTVEYGKPVEIFCVAENYLSSDIKFTLGGDEIDSEIVNATTRRLYFPEPEKQLKTYYCENIKTNKKCLCRLLVDTLPQPVTDFNCISFNFEKINCSWTSPKLLSSVKDNVIFSVNGANSTPPCVAHTIENSQTRYCFWNTSSTPRYRQLVDLQTFYLDSCNVFGCIYQKFTIDHLSIVKPDPPIDLNVVKSGTHSVLLKWKMPNNMIDFCPQADHIIEYQIAKIDNSTHFHRVNTSSLPEHNSTYRFNITNLPYANMKYEVRVYIKSKKSVLKEFWSDYSFVSFTTASEKPKRPPDMIAGSFAQGTFKNGRYIWVYWKQLEMYEEAGTNFTYKVVVSQDNKTQTWFANRHKSLSYVKFNASASALDVTVWSYNAVDSSDNSSHLYIPPEKDTLELQLLKFSKVAYENGTYELSWQEVKNIDNFTLFWCQHNQTQICTGRMDFAVLDSHKSSHVIDLPGEYRYQFAISVNNGTKTSGMVWATCDISKDGFVMYGFPVTLLYDTPGKFSVTLRWVMECKIKEGIIKGYNITYCPVVGTSSLCDESVKSKFFSISNPNVTNAKIENLLPARTYQFSLALNTIYGQKNIENASARFTASEDTPTNPVNIIISDVKHDSLLISWDPPLQRNGNIGKYKIFKQIDDQNPYIDTVSWTDTSRRHVVLKNLSAFTNYSLSVQACNIPINSCSKSKPYDGIFVRTRIGPPSTLKAPTVMYPDMLSWRPPAVPGGTVDRYQIKRVKDDMEPEILNTTALTFQVTYCEGVVARESYQVRAINFDSDLYHGVISDKNVSLPTESFNEINEFPGEWSEPSVVACRHSNGLIIIFVFMAVFALGGMAYGGFRFVKKVKAMKGIEPVFPSGLGVPEKDMSKYTFDGWNPTNKEEKPSSDEILLLPNSKTVPLPAHNKPKEENNCGSSEHTDSTALSDSTRGGVDRQASTSDDGSNSSLNLEAELEKNYDQNTKQGDPSPPESESCCQSFPYINDPAYKKKTSGYVQPIVNTANGYVQPKQQTMMSLLPTIPTSQQSNSSYVMAGLPPACSPDTPQSFQKPVSQTSGYVLYEGPEPNSIIDFSKINVSTSKIIGTDALPITPTLPLPSKMTADNSYIQLQSLDSMPSLKSSVQNTVPLKPPSSGYVSHAGVVINKHLNNMLTSGQLGEESAILDPTMSPDAYCRFSWNTDPTNDNLQSLLTDTPTQLSRN